MRSVFQAIRPILRYSLTFAALAAAIALSAADVRAARPSAMKLFPEETRIFVRVANAHEFGERMQQTSMGRMILDPQMKPFVDHVYGKAAELYAKEGEGKLGISWDDLKKLPQGEVAFGYIGEAGKMGMMLLVDQGKEPSVAEKLLDRAFDLAKEKGAEFTKEKIGDVDVTVVREAKDQTHMIGVFQRDNTIVAATDPSFLRNLLWHWDHPGETPPAAASTGEKSDVAKESQSGDSAPKSETKKEAAAEFTPTRTLAENAKFSGILRECRRKQDPPPHLIFFADPIGLVRDMGNAGGPGRGGFISAMLAPLGFDGLSGVGGAVTMATDQYDELAQMHILLENPRSGVLNLPAFEAGETEPQAFIPKDIASYMAFRWNLRTTYDRVCALVDQFGSKGLAEKQLKDNVSDKIGIDIVTQVIDNLKGRFSWIVAFDRPAHFSGQQHTIAAELKDEKAMTDALQTVVKTFPELFEERKFGKVTYYAIMPRRLKERPEDERAANPLVAVMDGYLFVGGSCQQFERCIAAAEGTADRLVDSDEYKRTSEVVGRETAGTTPFLFSVSLAEANIRQWYDLLTSPKTREKLDEQKQKSRFFAALSELFDEKKLPPFEVIAPYLGTGGGILYDTDNGYHAISFSLRNEAKP